MMWHTAPEYLLSQLVRRHSGVARCCGARGRSRNYAPKKMESQLFIEFPFM